MILQALKDYYDRKPDIAPEGWELRRFSYAAEIDEKGKFVRFHELKEIVDGNPQGKLFLVPSLGEKKGNGIKANFLWENIEYLFKIPSPTPAKPNPDIDRVEAQHRAFIEKLRTLDGNSPILNALRLYEVDDSDRAHVKADPLWEDVKKANQFIVLSIKTVGTTGWLPVTVDKEVRVSVDVARPAKTPNGYCLVSGNPAEIVRLEPAGIKGVYGLDGKAERTIVSFNRDPFISYRKEQNYNAPIGKQTAFAYTTALNTLLGKDSNQHLLVGDASMVFWSGKRTNFESDFMFFFQEPPKDDPDTGTRAVKNLFESVSSGAYREDEGTEIFYILGLSPNAARISVRFWQIGTVAEFADRIRRHFEDISIVKPLYERGFYSLWWLLKNIATQDKSENIPPNVAGDFMRSILDGTPYPQTLLQSALRRIRSDTENRVKPVRAALIKAYLNRYLHAHSNKGEKEIEMALDTEQPSIGYQLGRLFATFEKAQEDANGKATIQHSYYSSASGTPVVAFSTLSRLNKYHLSKLEKENYGLAITRKKTIGEIMGHLADFPPHLDLHEQGRFAIGYYHQMQDFFTKKEDKNN
jgi:CRISPR-associated protein Csd1